MGIIRELLSDILDRSAATTRASSPVDFLSPVTLANTALPVLVTVLTLVNSLTGSFVGLLDYRIRAILAIALISIMLLLSARVIIKKSFGSSLQPSSTRGRVYIYSHFHRQMSKVLLIPLLCLLFLSVSGLRFFWNDGAPIEGRVLGPNSRPHAGAVVQALNLDRLPVSSSPAKTDSNGRFVLDQENGRGAAYFLYMIDPNDSCESTVSLIDYYGFSYPLWRRNLGSSIIFQTHCS